MPREWGGPLQGFKSGYRSAEEPISEVLPSLVLGLGAAARLDGRLRDAAGRGIPGATVMVEADRGSPFGGDMEFATTDAEGRFVFDQVMVGKT